MLCLLAAGCAEDFVEPTDARECFLAAADTQDGGSGDADSFFTIAFDDASYPVDEPIVLYVCRGTEDAARVTVSDTEGVTVTPESLFMPSGDPKPPGIEVRVTGESDGRLDAVLAESGTGDGGDIGLYAVVDEGEWSLEHP